MTFEEFLSRFDRVKRRGDGATARCPAHDDKHPSLSIKRGDNGKPLFTCHAGCDNEQILAALGLTWRDVLGDDDGGDSAAFRSGGGRPSAPLRLRKEAAPPKGDPTEWEFDKEYSYTDEAGGVLYFKERYAGADGKKKFSQYRPDADGRKVYNLDGVRRVPYNLKELAQAKASAAGALRVFLVEGEKDCDKLAGLMSFDTFCKRGVWVSNLKDWQESFNAYLAGADAEVCISRDNDSAGLTFAENTARVVSAVAKSVKIVNLFDGAPEQGQDVSDWIANLTRDEGLGNEDIIERFLEIARTAPTWRDPLSKSAIAGGLEIEYLSTVTAKQISWLCAPLIPYGFYSLLDGVEGIGKTYAMLDLAKRLTRGEPMPFKGERHEPANVLFLSVEDSPEYILRPRFEGMGGDLARLAVLRGLFEFDAAGFANLEDTIERHGIKFVLIDPLFSFAGRADINSTADVRPITDRLNTIAATHGIALVGIRHVSKSKGYGDPANAGAHSRAWRQGCRSGLFIGHDAADKSKRGIAQTKLNVAAESKTVYGFDIDPNGVFRWTGESDLSVSEMLAQVSNESSEDRSAKADAVDFLRGMLSEGWKTKAEIDEGARGAGISFSTLNRAKKVLGIQPRKSGLGGWIWELPADSQG